MARNRQNLNIIYISDRMRETLRPIASCALTAVVAPMGYGKTTAVRWFLAEQAKAGAVVLQASIYSDNRSIFWKSVQKAFAAAGLTVLEGYDCPADASGAALLLEDLCAALGGKTPYYLFLDDFHLLGDERVAQFLCRLAYRLPENVHLIVASRNRFLPGEQVVRLGRRLHRIEADGLRLNREELLAYTHRCGVEITAAQAESLLRSCEGWFSAVYLNLHALAERGSLLQPGSDIYAMFTAAMLESLPEKTRGFLAVMGLADEFTVEMARAVTALPDAEEVLRALTQQNAFVTRLPDGVSFRFHHMMKECAERLFAQLPAARQTEVWQRYGRWYAQKAQYLHALQAFEHCGDRDAALAVIEADAGDLLASLSPAELLQRLGRCPVEALQRHPLAILVLMRRMFTWQQIPKMMELKALLEAKFHRPVFLANDMHYKVYGYYRQEQCSDQIVTLVNYPSGVLPGTATVHKGTLLAGKNLFAGMVGFLDYGMSLDQQISQLQRPTATPLIIQASISLISILNPHRLLFTGDLLRESDLEQIRTACLRCIPQEYMPDLLFVSDVEDYYRWGMYWTAMDRKEEIP